MRNSGFFSGNLCNSAHLSWLSREFVWTCFSCSIFRLEVVLVIHSGEHSVRVVCSELIHLENYTQPNAPGMTRYCEETKN